MNVYTRQPRSCRSTSSTSKLSIIAAVGRRTLPYRLNTGMRCTGSVKSGDSIMLSCLSPRSPCCGPNAATRSRSPSAASASSECTRSRVTDAGCASSATRRPASDFRSARSSSRRSIPNFIELRDERIGVVEIRLAGRVLERPIRKSAVFVFHYRRKRQRQRRPVDPYKGVELQFFPAVTHANAGIQLLIHERRAVAIACERVRGPFARGRQIEFAVAGQALAGDEDLAAGVLPEPGGDARRPRRGNAQAVELSLERIGHRDSFPRSVHARGHAAHRLAGASRMAHEPEAAARPAQPQRSQKKIAKAGGTKMQKRTIDASRRRSVSSNSGVTCRRFARSRATLLRCR